MNMKRTVILLSLVVAGCVAYGQQEPQKSNYPYWTISKDVQRYQYRNVQFQPAVINTADVAGMSSKGVSQILKKRNTATGSVLLTGMPSHVISKGVARMQYEKTNKIRP